MKARRIIAFLLILVSIAQSLSAQQPTEPVKTHSPKRATIYSAILPGMGQVYNKQAWKIPIIYAIGATTTYIAINNYQNSIKFKNEYFNRLDGKTSELLPDYSTYSDESILSLHEAYNKNFQLSVMITGVVYLLNIIDAMVYGHLFDFDINEDLGASIKPFAAPSFGCFSPSIGMSLSIRMK